MNKFVKVTDANGDTLYFRLDNIIAINENRGSVYCNNGDVFWLTDNGIYNLLDSIDVKE